MSDGTPDWALFYELDGGRPRAFREVRRVGAAVWVRSGAVKTWGDRETREYPARDAAEAGFQEATSQAAAEGFRLARQGRHDPAGFDFELLQRELRDGARAAFAAAREAHPRERLDCFGLLSDEGAMTLVPAQGSREARRTQGGDPDSLWYVDQWPYSEGDEFLDVPYRLLLPRVQDLPLEVEFPVFRSGVFEACVRALEELDREGCFGRGGERDRTLVLFDGGGDDDPEMVRRLNTPAMVRRYESWRRRR